ncbi:MAG: three-Cys-motif partner protein TcmP [Alphaproteobacteria bacterium]
MFSEINLERVTQGMRPISMECLFIFNDFKASAIEQLKQNVAPIHAEINDSIESLFIDVDYHSKAFNELYPEIKTRIQALRFGNVLFNLDQGGYKDVDDNIIADIMNTWKSAEVFLTFMIKALLTYLSPDQEKNRSLLNNPELISKIYQMLESNDNVMSKNEFLGNAEKIVFDNFKRFAPIVSPFSIHNPDGWQYWLIHFANSYRARQVYNDVLHENSTMQAHFGRSGLRMLSYDPSHEGNLYLFDESSRTKAKNELHDDIPRMISDHGDALDVMSFYNASYNETAAHSDDIHEMIIENPDVEVITQSGGERRVPNTIRPDDILRLRDQKSFFPMFIKGKIR